MPKDKKSKYVLYINTRKFKVEVIKPTKVVRNGTRAIINKLIYIYLYVFTIVFGLLL